MLNQVKRALVIAAHPDDEILGVGGTIAKLTNKGASVDILICTDGSSTQYENDKTKLDGKFEEAKKANDIVGAKLLKKLSFPDMKLDTIAHVEINKALSNVINEGNYDTVFVQDISDVNRDHSVLFSSALVACRPYPGQNVKRLLSYYVNSSTEWGNLVPGQKFEPQVFIDISDYINEKLDAMKEYITELREFPHPRSIVSIETSSKYFGGIIGTMNAEPFRLIYGID